MPLHKTGRCMPAIDLTKGHESSMYVRDSNAVQGKVISNAMTKLKSHLNAKPGRVPF
jgi:hypothetical protein